MISPLDIVFRLLLAAALGAVVGIERERREWTAGLRTHMLVCIGAALAIIVSAFGFADALGTPNVVLDPSRIAAQVISGIGFLGAGTIIFLERENVIRGLTTAAGLWAVAAIGLAAGAGMHVAAIAATAIVWLVLAWLKPIERRYFPRAQMPRMRAVLDAATGLPAVEAALAAGSVPLRKMVLRRREDGDELVLWFPRTADAGELARLADALRALPGLHSVEVRR